jgi:acyl-CoA synthetase (NDP forming)
VIGASDQPGNLGGDTVRRLLNFKFPGAVYPVSRSASSVAGLRAYKNVAELPQAAELAVMAIPASGLLEAVRECADAGVRHGIAYAGGLAEAGGEGAALQRELVALCREREFVLCGPNCVGVINATLPATSTFSTALYEMDSLRPGVISLVAQSGGIATSAFSMVQQAGFGLRYMVSSGNEAVVNFADYLHAFARDPVTRIIGGYLEGIVDAQKLVRALAEARQQEKPVVLIKAGMSGAGARAALAHTGALVGEDRVFDAVMREMGVIRVHSVEELVEVMLLLAGNPGKLCSGPGVGVVTFGGGNGVLAADQCSLHGLSTPALSAHVTERLKPLLVSVATAANPLDLTPTTAFRPDALSQLPSALDVFAAEPQLHSLLFIVGSLASKANEIAEVICGLAERSSKPVAACWPSPPRGVPGRLAERGVYVFTETARAIAAIARMRARAEGVGRPARKTAQSMEFDWAALVAADQSVVSEPQCHRILKSAGLPVAAGELVQDEAGAVRVAQDIGWPIVLKGVSAQITHRAKAGLIAVDLRSEDEVRNAFRRLTARASELAARMEGVYVQKMHKGGAELFVSAFRDPHFGPMVSCGAGGVLTEVIGDVVTERAPVSEALAAHMLSRLRIQEHPASAAAFISRLSQLAASAPWPRFILEINPVLWSRDAAVAVDGLLIIEASTRDGASR